MVVVVSVQVAVPMCVPVWGLVTAGWWWWCWCRWQCRCLYCMGASNSVVVVVSVQVAVDTMDSRQMTDKARAQVQRSRQQLVAMLIGIVVLFFTCLLPFRIVALYQIHR